MSERREGDILVKYCVAGSDYSIYGNGYYVSTPLTVNKLIESFPFGNCFFFRIKSSSLSSSSSSPSSVPFTDYYWRDLIDPNELIEVEESTIYIRVLPFINQQIDYHPEYKQPQQDKPQEEYKQSQQEEYQHQPPQQEYYQHEQQYHQQQQNTFSSSKISQSKSKSKSSTSNTTTKNKSTSIHKQQRSSEKSQTSSSTSSSQQQKLVAAATAATKIAANSMFGKFLQKGAQAAIGFASEIKGDGGYPTRKQEMILESLMMKLNTPFISGLKEHEEMLRELWKESKIQKEFERKSEIWIDSIGFENDDPSIEIRGSGILGLECLIYFAQTNYSCYHKMISKQFKQSKRVKNYYPFVKVSMNITYILSEEIGLIKKGNRMNEDGQESISSNHHWQVAKYWKLFNESIGFYELYSILFRLMDDNWTREFGEIESTDFQDRIMNKSLNELREILNEGPSDIEELWQITNAMGYLL